MKWLAKYPQTSSFVLVTALVYTSAQTGLTRDWFWIIPAAIAAGLLAALTYDIAALADERVEEAVSEALDEEYEVWHTEYEAAEESHGSV